MIDSRDIARRIAYWRRRRGMTMRHFADLVGRSVSWVEKIEKGERAVVRLPVLERVADALQISVKTLIDDAEADRAEDRPDVVEVAAIKSALGRYELLLAPEPSGARLSLDQLRQQTEYVNAAFLASDFAVVGSTLPKLITDGQRVVLAQPGDGRREAAAILVMIYKLASSTLHKFGSHDLAWLAADRAISAAATAGDPESLARSARCAARALMSVGQRREAIDLVLHVTARLEPELDEATPGLLSLVGMLWLAAEIAAAREGDAKTALAMHQHAEATARRLAADYSDPVTAFGRANVMVHRLSALVRLGDGPAALRFEATVDRAGLDRLPRERKANYLLDLAEAHRLCGHHRQAVDTLWNADQAAPQEIRRRPLTRELITALRQAESAPPSSRLRQLAIDAGLAV